MHLLAGQKRLREEYKDPDVLPKVNKCEMEGIMESIKVYLRSCCCVIRATLAYIIRKTLLVQIYGNYPKFANADFEMIARMLQLPLEKNKLHNEQSGQ